MSSPAIIKRDINKVCVTVWLFLFISRGRRDSNAIYELDTLLRWAPPSSGRFTNAVWSANFSKWREKKKSIADFIIWRLKGPLPEDFSIIKTSLDGVLFQGLGLLHRVSISLNIKHESNNYKFCQRALISKWNITWYNIRSRKELL